MSIKNILVIIALILFILPLANAQNYIGFNGGYCTGSFMNFSKHKDYEADYNFKNGYTFSSFYEKKQDSTYNLIIELQYKKQNAEFRVKKNEKYGTFDEIDYSFQHLNLNLIYSFRLIENKTFKLYYTFGMTFSYNINTIAKGYGWDGYTRSDWKKNEQNSKDLSKFNCGVDSGINLIIPVNDKIDFLFQNRYNMFISNIMNEKRFRFTSLFTGLLNIGFRYNL